MSTDNEHAIANARGWLANIHELVATMQAVGDDVCSDAYDEAREAITSSALSVQVRGGWYSPGALAEDREAEEFEILLSTGGPALRIIGELNRSYPEKPRLQWQDWFVPWTDYDTTDADDLALQAFCAEFYFGEG